MLNMLSQKKGIQPACQQKHVFTKGPFSLSQFMWSISILVLHNKSLYQFDKMVNWWNILFGNEEKDDLKDHLSSDFSRGRTRDRSPKRSVTFVKQTFRQLIMTVLDIKKVIIKEILSDPPIVGWTCHFLALELHSKNRMNSQDI